MMKVLFGSAIAMAVVSNFAVAAPNILLITADDLNCDSVGVYGCGIDGITPHIDSIARQGAKFEHGHVTIAVCQPSRSVWMTGRYPINSGGEGFHKLKKKDVPILPQLLRDAGYSVGILGKFGHSTPHKEFSWDMQFDMKDLGMGRSPESFSLRAKKFISEAKEAKKPFFLMANSHDPHRAFYGNDNSKWYSSDDVHKRAAVPSRVYQAEEVPVPKFLPDLPEVRREVAEYFSSVKRCDDTVGAILKVLDDAGERDNTLVLFMADNGMAFPFSKTNCFYHSTHTPYLMRWPGKIESGTVVSDAMVSGIDVTPTLLEAAGVKSPEGVDGQSVLPLLAGEKQKGRDRVFTQFHQTSSRKAFEMRGVQSKQFGYIYNGWSDGEKRFRNESMIGRTFKAMREAAESHPEIAKRVDHFTRRQPEEFYDYSKDPDGLNNLIDHPEYKVQIEQFRAELKEWMIQHQDPELSQFQTQLQ
ncbi:sulfatase [Rubritalea tangerina]|uniref:Sulfatase n=1 Tax=Rubritalea tangerina TaxID=430798 RepID=A0ABW4Z775_9BACT